MDKELKLMLYAFIPPAFLVLMMWFVKYLEYSSGFGFFELGVYPRHWEGLRGILASPFIHADISHLISNSIPLLLLGAGLIYFYHSLAFRVFALIFLLSGCGLWIGGREVYHIGASGLVYGLAFFFLLVAYYAAIPDFLQFPCWLFSGMAAWFGECFLFGVVYRGKDICLALWPEYYVPLFIGMKVRKDPSTLGKWKQKRK